MLFRSLVNIEDNPQLDERERRDLVARYKKRKALYNRFILGIWEQDITDGHFSDVWDESVHVVGNADGPKDEWEVLVPTSDCRELITGWDLGEKKSHSFHILEKIIYEHEGQVIVGFNVIDEIVVVDQFVSIEDFTVECLEKMDHWENYVVKNFQRKPSWRHWSDTSAFELRTSSNDMDAAIVYNASKGKIILQGAPKYRDSNRDKVKLLWQLLFTKRLIVSASCFSTRKMFSMLRPSPGSAVSKYVKRDNHKHPFDSLSYAVMSEAPVDMFRSAEIDPTAKESAPRPVFANF